MEQKLAGGCVWTFEQFERDGRLVSSRTVHNLMPEEGRSYVIDAAIANAAQRTAWYCGVYEGDFTPDGTETAATIAGAAAECTAYSDATRPAIVFGTVSDGSIDNGASKVEMTFTADKTLYGGFVSSSPVKGGTTGVLLSVARAGPEVVRAGRKLVVSVSFNLVSM